MPLFRIHDDERIDIDAVTRLSLAFTTGNRLCFETLYLLCVADDCMSENDIAYERKVKTRKAVLQTQQEHAATLKRAENVATMFCTAFEKMYRDTVMNPHKYPHMNKWAYLSMEVLNMMKEKDMCPDDAVLHIAVMQGFPNVVKKILEFPYLDVNSKGFNGRTPLHECLISLNPNMKILL